MSAVIPLRTIGPGINYATAAREVLQANLAIIAVWAAFLDQPDRAHEHHLLRIMVKRLRYNLELFTDLVPSADQIMEALRDAQDALGTLHDLDELLLSIQDTQTRQKRKHYTKRQEILRARAAEKRISLDVLLGEIRAERETCYQRCRVLWQNLEDQAVFTRLRQDLEALAYAENLASADVPKTKG